jgi:hypothetical protein
MLIMSNLIPSPLGPSPSSKHQLQQDVSWPMMEQSWVGLTYKIFNTGVTAFVVELQFLLVTKHFRC